MLIGTVIVTVVPFTVICVVGILLTVTADSDMGVTIVVPTGKIILILSIPPDKAPLAPVVKEIV